MSVTAEEALEMIRDRIVAACEPEEIILFGSHARGDAGPDSDLDLLVVMENVPDHRGTRVNLYNALRGIPFPKDLIVAGSGELTTGNGSPIVKTAIAEGRRVYRRKGYVG